MSIALMTIAWKSDIQTGSKIVLLCLCDNANDQGECYPSVSMMAKKCSMSERSIFNHLDILEKMGAIEKMQRTGRSTIYKLDPCKFCTPANSAPLQRLHHTPAESAPIPLQNLHPTPAESAPITIKESSIEPSSKQKNKSAPLCVAVSVLPDWINPDIWKAYLDMRKSIKKPMTDYAKKLAIGKLDGYRKKGIDIDVVINQSILQNWTDLYEPKQDVPKADYEPRYAKYMREKMEQISPSIAAKKPNSEAKRIDPNEFLRTIEAQNVVRIN